MGEKATLTFPGLQLPALETALLAEEVRQLFGDWGLNQKYSSHLEEAGLLSSKYGGQRRRMAVQSYLLRRWRLCEDDANPQKEVGAAEFDKIVFDVEGDGKGDVPGTLLSFRGCED